MSDLFDFRKPKAMSVSELAYRLRDYLESDFGDVFVEGEIGSFTCPRSGHYYFSLKDSNAQVSAVMFKMRNRYLRFKPEEGMVVVARGRMSCYVPRGSMQLIIDYMEPKGAGELAAAFEQRKSELAAKGYFDAARKKPIPAMPKVIGIATSATGAALYDAMRTIFLRNPRQSIVISPTRVQGDGAAEEIAEAVEMLVEDGRSEVILLIRGGGSQEDLWQFNELEVAEAIYRCPVPLVTGVGHEIDFTIADFCADVRSATPTAAAELVTPRVADYELALLQMRHRLSRAQRIIIEKHRVWLRDLTHRIRVRSVPTLIAAQRLDDLTLRLGRSGRQIVDDQKKRLVDSDRRLQRAEKGLAESSRKDLAALRLRLRSVTPAKRTVTERRMLNDLTRRLMLGASRPAAERKALDAITLRLAKAAGHAVENNRKLLDRQEKLLDALSPLKILERGYSITTLAETGAIVRDATQAVPSAVVDIRLHRGKLTAVVEKSEPDESKEE